MTPKRPKRLTWIGPMLPDGRPAQHLMAYGLKPQDYSAEETDALDADQIALARQHPELYRVHEQPAPKPKPAKTARASRPDGAEEIRGADTRPESTATETPATDAHSGEEG